MPLLINRPIGCVTQPRGGQALYLKGMPGRIEFGTSRTISDAVFQANKEKLLRLFRAKQIILKYTKPDAKPIAAPEVVPAEVPQYAEPFVPEPVEELAPEPTPVAEPEPEPVAEPVVEEPVPAPEPVVEAPAADPYDGLSKDALLKLCEERQIELPRKNPSKKLLIDLLHEHDE